MNMFNQYFISTLKNNYANFNTKATRSEYWYFVLFYVLVSIVLKIIDTFMINPLLGMTVQESSKGGLLQFIFALALIIPLIAIGIRRLHDIRKSGWWMLISLVPVIGTLVLLYFFIQKSK